MSVAVPAGTVLTGTPTVPSGWTVIYTTSATSTAAAAWVTAAPSPLSGATRVGSVAAGPIARSTSLTGFGFSVFTGGVSLTAPPQVAALAQLFGNSSGDVTGALCYDESGDAAPVNFNDDGSYGSNVPRSGVANPVGDGTDIANNNTGTGAGGQDNVYTVQPAGALAIGPSGQPHGTARRDLGRLPLQLLWVRPVSGDDQLTRPWSRRGRSGATCSPAYTGPRSSSYCPSSGPHPW